MALRGERACATSTAYKRAVCAATEAFAEFGSGEVGGYAIGSGRVLFFQIKCNVFE